MYLFSRLATLRGNERKSMTWAVEMNGYVDAHSDHSLSLWRADFGHPVGTVAWAHVGRVARRAQCRLRVVGRR